MPQSRCRSGQSACIVNSPRPPNEISARLHCSQAGHQLSTRRVGFRCPGHMDNICTVNIRRPIVTVEPMDCRRRADGLPPWSRWDGRHYQSIQQLRSHYPTEYTPGVPLLVPSVVTDSNPRHGLQSQELQSSKGLRAGGYAPSNYPERK